MSWKDADNEEPRLPTTVGQRIRDLRERRGMSLTALADAAGVSKSYLHDLENDVIVKPSADFAYSIAQVLDTTVAQLLGKRRNPLEGDGTDTAIEIPDSLEEFAREARISYEDKRRLACIKYKGQSPKTKADWAYLYETIKRVVGE